MSQEGGDLFPCCATPANTRLAFVVVDFMKAPVLVVPLADWNFYFVY